ncbi:beta-glucosidase BglX [Porticoccus sp. W117]|uniref:beta-glucosidase BglX n=1 Tax=Porticoccus sp. W117 TaxID=3054777 RepID=UPI0025986231|nr:beta-glucosidase BglX [Porticoccus sp. W117]MDM3870036.1 beta-glucosidase BglX [Porticoccus sp. W117]
MAIQNDREFGIPQSTEEKVSELIQRMNLDEKIGQMSQLQAGCGHIPDHLADDIRHGRVGSVLNEVNVDVVNELQRISIEETRLGIPLLIGRDVIHGFKTVFPIPLGLAASWDPQLIKQTCRISAQEAASCGVNWTFAPMIDISRDPRWGRVAESLGEDPYLCATLGAAMVDGFQGDKLSEKGAIAACAKHFAAYGAAEAGKDYNTVNVPENELRNVYLRPFKKLADSGVASFMTAFCDLNGVPATGNSWLLDDVLRKEWDYRGLLVSDWDSVIELSVHGFTHNDKESACEAVNAGVDMEMASRSYKHHLQQLVDEGRVDLPQIDRMVARILTLKFDLGLFDNPYTSAADYPALVNVDHLEVAQQSAAKSCVLLKNDNQVLPLNADQMSSIAVIGPLADDDYEQLGTWVFDGDPHHSVTCKAAIERLVGDKLDVRYCKGLQTTRSESCEQFSEALELAAQCDATVVVVGEESFMSGEAHSRASIDLPGQQVALIDALAKEGKPLIVVVMAGRPLTIENILDKADSILYAWHPGTMGGPAIADLLFGFQAPSGKLPVTFPRAVGQIPIYYAHKNTGRPVSDVNCLSMADIPERPEQTSLGMASFHLDVNYRPLFPFGYGLSYTCFEYSGIRMARQQVALGGQVEIVADIKNTGHCAGEEVVQLYIRDLVGSVTRPVKELKGFQRVLLQPGEQKTITFTLHTDELAFYGRDMQLNTEPGSFQAWVGGDSDARLMIDFDIYDDE